MAGNRRVVSEMQTIVVGYRVGEDADRALARAIELAERFGAHLVVASANEPVPVPAIAPDWPLLAPRAGDVGAVLSHDEAADALAQAREQLESTGLRFTLVPVDGPATDAVLDVADEVGADLVVVGSREHGFLERLLEGSVSEAVVRRAPCDVLVVR